MERRAQTYSCKSKTEGSLWIVDGSPTSRSYGSRDTFHIITWTDTSFPYALVLVVRQHIYIYV
jgi:hypothetical protein